MILFDLIDFFIAVYTSLGFGTKEYKIERKMEKLSKHSPQINRRPILSLATLVT